MIPDARTVGFIFIDLQDTYEMMKSAESIVSECRVIFEFVKIIAGQCADQQ